MLEGLCGCIMACNVFLAGNSEISLELHCFTAELITYIVCECDAPEWTQLIHQTFAIEVWFGTNDSTYYEPFAICCEL